MTTSRSEQVLKSLDHVLSKIQWKGPPSDTSHLNSPQHLACFKKLGNQEQVTSQRILAQALHRAEKNGGTLRICSVGCEDGKLDRLILEGLKSVQVQYVGLDTDELIVEAALDRLQGLSSNIEAKTVAVDYEEVNALTDLAMEQFDLIWMVNCTYYAASLTQLIQGVLELLKPSGVMIVISSSQQSLEELVTRFWAHQRQHPLQTTESLVDALSSLGLPHQVHREPVTFDLTTHLGDRFLNAGSEMVLDHLVFCRLIDYPPEVKKLVIEFLLSIAETSENYIKVTSLSDLVCISHSSEK